MQNYNLAVVVYGYETWSCILKKDFRLSVFENRVLKKVLGHKRDEVTGEWSGLHFEEVYGNRRVEQTAFEEVYQSTNVIRGF